MPEQKDQEQKDQDAEWDNKSRRGRGGREMPEDRVEGGGRGPQQAKETEYKPNETKVEDKRDFESAGRGVRAKTDRHDQREKEFGEKSGGSEAGATPESNEGDDDSPSDIRGGAGGKKSKHLDEDDMS